MGGEETGRGKEKKSKRGKEKGVISCMTGVLINGWGHFGKAKKELLDFFFLGGGGKGRGVCFCFLMEAASTRTYTHLFSKYLAEEDNRLDDYDDDSQLTLKKYPVFPR